MESPPITLRHDTTSPANLSCPTSPDNLSAIFAPNPPTHRLTTPGHCACTRYILFIDADMVLTRPIDPVELGAKKGTVVSEYVPYMIGTSNEMARNFLSPEAAPLAKSVGWYHIFHRDDLLRWQRDSNHLHESSAGLVLDPALLDPALRRFQL